MVAQIGCRSRNQHQRSGGVPPFEQAMRRGGLRKWQRMGWRRRQRAAGERIEQFARCGLADASLYCVDQP